MKRTLSEITGLAVRIGLKRLLLLFVIPLLLLLAGMYLGRLAAYTGDGAQ